MLVKPLPSLKPICPFFYECGGCDTQDISYADQVAYKNAWLQELFKPLLQAETAWKPFLHSPEEYPVFFRNKIRFSFIEHEGHVWPSRHRKGEERADIPVDMCFLHSEESMDIVNFTAQFAEANHWSLYDPLTGIGWLKHLLIRQSKAHNTFLLSLVTDEGPIPNQASWIHEVTARFPHVVSLFHTVSWGKSNERLEDTHLWGATTITEQVGEQQYVISPQAFFQTNGAMVETLYDTIRATAQLQPNETLWDLYAGSATIGLYLASRAKSVVSIESNPANCADATANIALNAVTNVTIVPGMVEKVLSSAFIEAQGHPDVIIVDPPRAGLHESLRRILPFLDSGRLIYVSCNPLTCVRDVQELQRRGYTLKSVQGLDMFPHSLHCEVVVELSRALVRNT